MKNKLSSPALLLLGFVFIHLSCNKNSSSDQLVVKQPFNATAAKEWYYGSFKKSAEWSSSVQKGKKIPDWKNPALATTENSEIVVFPLIQQSTRRAVSATTSGKTLSKAQIMRIAEGSITKIAFIKNSSGNILVREVDYIPDLDYLEAKKYDISAVNFFSSDNDFSGKVIIKKWEGEIISAVLLKKWESYKAGFSRLKK